MDEKRDSNVDYDFFKQMQVSLKWYQPWQVGLFHPDIQGKFVWYPERGTLMYESEMYSNTKLGEFATTEAVWNEISKKLP